MKTCARLKKTTLAIALAAIAAGASAATYSFRIPLNKAVSAVVAPGGSTLPALDIGPVPEQYVLFPASGQVYEATAFGTARLGGAEVTRTVRIANFGAVPTTVALHPALASGRFYISKNPCGLLAAKATCDLTMAMKTDEAWSGTSGIALVGESDLQGGYPMLSGTVSGALLAIASGQTSYSFGQQDLGGLTQAVDILVKNNGNEATSLSFSGLSGAMHATPETDGPLEAQAFRRVKLSMTADVVGVYDQALQIADSDGKHLSVRVTGRVDRNTVDVESSRSVNLGDIVLGAEPPSVSVTLRNTGTRVASFAIQDPAGGGEYRFSSVGPTTCDAVQPNATCVLTVRLNYTRVSDFSNVQGYFAAGNQPTILFSGRVRAQP